MGFFDAIGSAIHTVVEVGKNIISSVAEAAVNVVTKIGGPVMRSVGNFVARIPIVFPPPWIEVLKFVLFTVIPTVTELLEFKPDKEETPEELGKKAEIAYEENQTTPEDFDSTQAYIQYLREEIHADRKELENLSDAERMKYAAVGDGLYVRGIEEKYRTKLEPEFWRAAAASHMEPDRVSALIPALSQNGVESGKLVDDYFANRLQPGSVESDRVVDALAQAVGQRLGTTEIAPIRTEINQYERTYAQTVAHPPVPDPVDQTRTQ